MSQYFALNEKDIEFDNTIRDTIKKAKTKSHMALYLQGQEELNLLRELVQRQRDMSCDMDILHSAMKHYDELVEQEGHGVNPGEAYLQILDEITALKYSINGLIEYICEDNEDDLEELTAAQRDIVRDANSLARLHAAKAAKTYSKSLSKEDKHIVELWDYILCALEFVKDLYD